MSATLNVMRVRTTQLAMVLGLVAAAIFCLGGCGSAESGPDGPLKIGIMLPVSGTDDVGWKVTLEWAQGNINHAGGIAGQPLELVYVDTAKTDLETAAKQLANDDSILGVIGPDTSRGTFLIADVFTNAKKPFVSASATSGDIFRAFGQSPYVWRSVQSDIGQAAAMLLVAKAKGVKKVALLTGLDPYGSTFFDWIGFFATEIGLEVTKQIRIDYEQTTCERATGTLLSSKPDGLFAVPSTHEAAVCIAKVVREKGNGTLLLFSDYAQSPDLIRELGEDAEGLAGLALAPAPASGFNIAFRTLFDRTPPPYAANTYDAVLLLAYGLERSNGRGHEALAKAMDEVVHGTGELVSWDRPGVMRALSLLRKGDLPDISGATGSLSFEEGGHTDLAASTYGLWHVERGDFVFVAYFNTGFASNWGVDQDAAFSRYASEAAAQTIKGGDYEPGPKTGSWALVAGLSGSWSNYRHQADALAQYQLLKAQGFQDDHIIFILADDLATSMANKEKGVVRNVARGDNLYVDMEVDYVLKDVTAVDLLTILKGTKSSKFPKVIESTAGDNVYVFLVGHGSSQGLFVGASGAADEVGESATVLTPANLGSAVKKMSDEKRYRRLLMIIEACHSGVMGEFLTAPGAWLLTAANPNENSLADNYDGPLDVWLADQFAYNVLKRAKETPNIDLQTLYRDIYLSVAGSHVSAYNSFAFGAVDKVQLSEFIGP